MQFVGTFWALVPPIIAITLALITKEAYSSLFIGVVIGALFACNFAPVATIDMIVNDGIIAAIADNAGIFLFLVLLGIIVALVNLAGGSAAFGRWAEKNIHTRVGAQLATFILGILIFIDDYFQLPDRGLGHASGDRPPPDLSSQARLPHRRHCRSRVHDRADLVLGGRRVLHG